ncbi:MAG: hypothetical protein HQ559_12060 [Lentisphaerae bacterium]|nr:hypothetical protein [Lentisphaerota bacterium]
METDGRGGLVVTKGRFDVFRGRYVETRFSFSPASFLVERPDRRSRAIAFDAEQTTLSVRVLDIAHASVHHVVAPVHRLPQRGSLSRRDIYIKTNAGERVDQSDPRFGAFLGHIARFLPARDTDPVAYLFEASCLYANMAPGSIRHDSVNPTNN